MATRLIETGSIDIEAIKDQYPLASVVEQHVTLKRKAGKLEGLCPFHEERHASFKIYEQDQRYHCFGCGAHGDLFDFLEHVEGLDIRAAAERLTGGTFPVYTAERIEELRAKRAAFEAKEAEARAKVIQWCRDKWDTAVPVDIHPYLTTKGISAHGTRADGDGNLLTPLIGHDGKIQCLQGISPAGEKDFPYRGTVTGGFFIIGGKVVSSTAPIILCEGFATAASIHEATGNVVICTYNGSNMVAVAKFFGEKYSDKSFIIAADDDHTSKENVGARYAAEAASVLKCHVVKPFHAAGSADTDFNDMAKAFGLESVRHLIVDGILPGGETNKSTICDVDAFDFEESAIPVRPWLIKGVLLERHTHMLVAPGGSGKSLFTLQLATMLATGQQWGEWKAKRRCRTAIVNVEDDITEQRRRLAAARKVMMPDPAMLKGMLRLIEHPESIVVARVDSKSKSVISTPIVSELRLYIEQNKIDVLIVDPFAETFEGDENSNSEVKWAMKVWRDEIARPTGCAVYLVHHTVKYASGGAGNADMIRGAGAIVNSTRISSTLFPMTIVEASALGVEEDRRNRYVRFDDAKANQSLVSSNARWFEKISVTLDNGGGFDEPDEVGALKPWQPPSSFAGVSLDHILNALALIQRGVEDDRGPTGEPFTAHYRAHSTRWAGRVIVQAMGVEEARAKVIIKDWMDTGLLYEIDYQDKAEGKTRKGVSVNQKLIPTHAEGVRF